MTLGYQYNQASLRLIEFGDESLWPENSANAKSAYATPISDVNSPEFKIFHEFLTRELHGQVESLDVLKRELLDPSFIFIAVTSEPPSEQVAPTFISGAYASVVPLNSNSAILAVRFAFTVEQARGSGVSLVTIDRLIAESRRVAELQSRTIKCMVGEAIESSEHFVNKIELFPGHGRKRLYIDQPGRVYKELAYSLPALEWHADGTPKSAPIDDHLMLAHVESATDISASNLIKCTRAFWNQWYLRPSEDFESDQAWRRHKIELKRHFDSVLVRQLAGVEKLILLSANERETLRQEGYTVIDFKLAQ